MGDRGTPVIEVARPPSNVVVVAEALREAIVDGRLKPGERIKEIPMAERLGVSRGPIRDALRVLAHEGLVEIVPNRGAIVPEVRSFDVLEVYALRAAIGSLALHKLMNDSLEAARPDLDAALAQLQRAVAAGDEQDAADADLLYQSAIVDGSGLPRLSREWERLTWQVRMFIATLDMHYLDKLAAMLAEIQALDSAIVAGDDHEAQHLWREKFERWVCDFIERIPDQDFDAEMWAALTAGVRSDA